MEEWLSQFNFPINTNVPSFARGLEILLVDDDVLSLVYISSMLEEYSFKVTTAERASVALSMIREQKNKFRLVIANINKDNFSNLHEIKGELPVVVMSTDRRIAVRAIAEGASYFLEKPVALKDLKPVWQHANWKRKDRNNEIRQENVVEKGNNQSESQGIIKINETATLSRPPMEGNIIKEASGTFRPPSRGIIIKEPPVILTRPREVEKTLESGGFPIPNTGCEYHGNLRTNPLVPMMQKKPSLTIIIDEEDNSLQNTKKQEGSRLKRQLGEREGDTQEKRVKTGLEITNSGGLTNKGKGKKNDGAKKKPRAVWNKELHSKFIEVIRALGEDYASPRMIHEKMNVPGISTRLVSRHLQKYKAERQTNNETGITSLPPTNLPTCTHALTAFAPPLERWSPLMSQHGQGNVNFGAAGTSQSSILQQPTQPEQNQYRDEVPLINEARTRNLPSISQPSCKHARSAFSLPLERQNPLLSHNGQGNLDLGIMGTSQSIPSKPPTRPEVNGHRAELQQTNETGTSIPYRSQLSCSYAKALFPPSLETQSSLLSPHGHASFDFGSAGNVQCTIPKPQTQPQANVGSFLSNGQKTSQLSYGKIGSSSNSDVYHKHIPDAMQIETHGMIENFNQRKTSSYSMNEKGKGKQPLEEVSGTLPSIMNFPNLFFDPPAALLPYMSAVTQVPELNLLNSSHSPPRVAFPYMPASTRVSDVNFENSSHVPPRVPSPNVAACNQISEVNEGSSYVPPRETSPYVTSGVAVFETNLHNSSYAPPMAPSPYMAAGTQVSEVNSPTSYAPVSEPTPYAASSTRVSEMNLSQSGHAPPRAASPYMAPSTQVSKVNFQNSSHAPPTAPYPNVAASNQDCEALPASEVSLANSSYVPPRAPSPCMAASAQLSETNENNLSYEPPRAPSPYMAAGTQVSEVNLLNSYAPPSEPTLSAAANTRVSEVNLSQLSYAAPSAPPPYVASSARVSKINLASSSYVPPEVPSSYVSADTRTFEMSIPSSADTLPKVPSSHVPAGMFQLPNSPSHLNENQKFLPDLAIGMLTSATTGMVSSATTAVVNFVAASSIMDGNQNLDPAMKQASAADSPNQSFSEYAEILRILDEDAARFHDFEYGPNFNDHYFEWLQKNMDDKNTDPC